MPLGSTGLPEQTDSTVQATHGSNKVHVSSGKETLEWELFHGKLIFTQ